MRERLVLGAIIGIVAGFVIWVVGGIGFGIAGGIIVGVVYTLGWLDGRSLKLNETAEVQE